MRSISIVLTILAGTLVNAVHAQPDRQRTPEEKARNLTDKMVERLGLSDEQSEKVYQLNAEGAQELEPYVNALHEARKALDEARRRVVESKTSELRSLLTPEQFAEFEKNKAEREGRRAENRERCKERHKPGEVPED